MRRFLPPPVDQVDPNDVVAAEDRDPPHGRPWIMVNMVASVDGSVVAGEGRSGPLGGRPDRAMFHALRGAADVILAGANTVRVEGYGPPVLPPEVRAARVAAGRQPLPRLAVVSRSLHLDPTSRFFRQEPSEQPPIILTSTAARRLHGAAAEALAPAAALVDAGEANLDWHRALEVLRRELGVRVLLVEGGPEVNGQLIAAGLVDELCLTISPTLTGGSGPGVATAVSETGPAIGMVHDPSAPPQALHRLWLSRVLEEDGFLLLRYLAGC